MCSFFFGFCVCARACVCFLLCLKDDAASALSDCQEALRLFPGHERASVRLATCKLYMCEFEGAKALLQKCRQSKLQGNGLDADVREKLSVVEAILKLVNVTSNTFPMNKSHAETVVSDLSKHLEYVSGFKEEEVTFPHFSSHSNWDPPPPPNTPSFHSVYDVNPTEGWRKKQ